MVELKEKVSYLKGLMEGLDIDAESKEGKVFNAILEVLEEVVINTDELEECYDDLADSVEAIDEDLADIEEFLDDVEADFPECYVVCPNCNETVYLDEEEIDKGEVECPNCSTVLEFDPEDVMVRNCHCGCDCDSDCHCGCQKEEENSTEE